MTDLPWTQEELQECLPKLKQEMADIEADMGGVRPMNPMTVEEALEFLHRVIQDAQENLVTPERAFMHGQLLVVFQHAVAAETLGKKGYRTAGRPVFLTKRKGC